MPVIDIRKFISINTRTVDGEGNIYYLRDIVNFTVSHVLGRLLKRKMLAQKAIDLGTNPRIKELVDDNLTRNLIVKNNNAGIFKKVWNGTNYGDIEPVTDTPMPSGYTISTFYPQIHRNTLYCGAGTGDTDYPFYIQYIKEWVSKIIGDITVPADLYLLPAENSKAFGDNFTLTAEFVPGNLSHSFYMEQGRYFIKVYPVYVDGSIGSEITSMRRELTAIEGTDVRQSLQITIRTIDNFDITAIPNLQGFDIFIAHRPEDVTVDIDFPYYFLERIKFDEKYQGVISTHMVEFINNSHGDVMRFYHDYNDVTYDLADNGVMIIFDHNGQHYELYPSSLIVDTGGSVTEVYATINGGVPSELMGETDIHVKMKAFWQYSGVDNWGMIKVFYDAYYNKLTGEMYKYLGVPSGMTPIENYRYEISAISENVIFTFRRDSIYGYYSPPDAFNVFTYSNEIVLKDLPVAVIPYLDGVLVLHKKSTEFIRRTPSGDIVKQSNYFQFGAIRQEGVIQTGSNEAYVMSLSGVWKVSPSGARKISEMIQSDVQSDYILKELELDELQTVVASYNHIRREVIFMFLLNDASVIAYVYDLSGTELNGVDTWVRYKFDHMFYSSDINIDGHQLLATGTFLYDFNDPNPNESVSCELELQVLDSQIVNKKIRIDRLNIKTNNPSAANVNFTLNGSVNVPAPLNEKGERYIRAIAEDAKLRLTTQKNSDEFYIDRIQISYKDLNR